MILRKITYSSSLLVLLLSPAAFGEVASPTKMSGQSATASKHQPATTKSTETSVSAKDKNIKVISISRALQGSPEGAQAVRELQKRGEELSKIVQAQELEVTGMIEELKKKYTAGILKPEALEEQQRKIERRGQEVQAYKQACHDELTKLSQTLTEPLIHDLETFVMQAGRAEKVDLIIDTDSMRVLYADERVDLTSAAVDFLTKNQEYKLTQVSKGTESTRVAETNAGKPFVNHA